MSTATKDTVTVTFDPNSINLQSDVITGATPTKAGAMTAAQAAKLAGLLPGGGETLTQAYDNGSSSADQTVHIAGAKGGAVQFKGLAALAGSLVSALTSIGGKLFDVVDAVIPIVKLAGTFIQDDPVFGSPVMGSQTPGGFMSYTSDGIGGVWGGTGMTAQNVGGGSSQSLLVMTVEDNPIAIVNQHGFEIAIGQQIGIDGANNIIPVSRIAGDIFRTTVGAPLTVSANAIAPTKGIHSVGAGLIKNITVPYVGFTGSIVLRPTAAFTYDATGNILVAGGGGTATVARDMVATYDGAKWAMSY